jgi:hypothetical protein
LFRGGRGKEAEGSSVPCSDLGLAGRGPISDEPAADDRRAGGMVRVVEEIDLSNAKERVATGVAG